MGRRGGTNRIIQIIHYSRNMYALCNRRSVQKLNEKIFTMCLLLYKFKCNSYRIVETYHCIYCFIFVQKILKLHAECILTVSQLHTYISL